VGWLSGAFLLVNRDAFEEIAGFDTGYFMFVEDVDLGMRLGQAGWSCVYAPRARATHTVGHVTKDHKGQMAKAHHTSMKRFLKKRYPGILWFPLRVALNLGLSLRQLLVRAVWAIRKTSPHSN
jgi:N-acetylglucosaminyl-diphospho-decaprenol L-rhamnosyltransferase